MTTNRTNLINRMLFGAVCVIFVSHALYYLPYYSDDGFISLRYSRRLVAGLGLTWTDGEWVEGYTNLLWVLINAATGWMMSDYVLSTRVWGIIGGLLCITFITLNPDRPVRIERARLLSGGMLLALSAPLAVWAIGGLEQSFFAGSIAGALFWLIRALDERVPRAGVLLLSGLFFGITALTRADGVTFFAAAAAGILISGGLNGQGLRTIAILAILPVTLVTTQLIFRIHYYGELVPNTALAKVAFNTTRLVSGLTYVKQSLLAISVIIAAAATGTVLMMRHVERHRWAIPITMFFVWIGYIVSVGGDIFNAWRQILPALVPLAFLVAEGAMSRAAVLRTHKIPVGIGLSLLLAGHFVLQLYDERCSVLRRNDFWVVRGEAAGKLLKRSFGAQRPLLAVDAAGALPFWSELPALDMLGLTDRYLTANPPPWFGTHGIGHELGDGDYVLRRNPDIIVFNSALGDTQPFWPSARQMYAKPRFHEEYKLTKVRSRSRIPSVLNMFVKRENSAVGIKRSADEIRIPGYLFSGIAVDAARPGRNNALFTPLTGKSAPFITGVHLEAGTWLMTTDHPIPSSGYRMSCEGGTVNKAKSPYFPWMPYAIKIVEPTEVSITFRTPAWLADPVSLYEVILKRVPEGDATVVCTPEDQPVPATLADLQTKKSDGTPEEHFDNLRFGEAGVSVALPAPIKMKALRIGLDGGSRIHIEYRRGQQVLGTSIVAPQSAAGIQEHTIKPPRELSGQTVDRLIITPEAGAALHSLAHLFVETS